ncbi:MAG TPA: hypothetical protein VFZ20_05005 [Longimicrobium sp.]|nr:hypothetical protein [Longimicrobium sp.]
MPNRAVPSLRRRLLPLSAPLVALLAACEDPAGGAPATAQTCAAPIQLAVGQSADLQADADGKVRCRIEGSAGSEFVVAFVDTRATQKARTENEGYGDAFSAYAIAADLSDDVPAPPAPQLPSASVSPGGAPDFDVQNALPPQGHATYRATPWTLDERFGVYDGGTQTVRTARVLRIYGGRYVFAWLEGENEPQLAAFMAQLDSAWAGIVAHGLPLMRAAYSDQDPVTSPGSGQYLVVLRAIGRGTALGWTVSIPDFGTPRIWTEFKVIPQASALRLGEIMAHELAHAFQATYMFRTRPAGVTESAAGAAYWGVEGGADLVAFETTRRVAGVPLTANLDMSAAPASPAARRVAEWGRGHGGALTNGYADAAGFLRWQAALRVRAGDTEDAAVTEVLRGASDGWYGFDNGGARRTGLVERMRSRLDAAWSPEDALLDWALAHAADDRTTEARWQDPTYLRVWQGTGGGGGWQPQSSLPAPGGPAFVSRPYGSPDYLVIRTDRSEPFAASSSVPGVRWRIVRVR